MTAPLCLLTRPEALSRAFAAELPGFDSVISPILRIEALDFDAGRVAAAPGLVFTSARAVPMAGPGAGRPALCVGPQTAAAARAAGFAVTEGPGDAEGLIPLLAGREDWLHLHGRHLARRLPVPGIAVYDQIAEKLNDSAWAALSGLRGVILPLFSPRSAALLSDALSGAANVTAPIAAIAISASADQAYRGPARLRQIASQPDRAAMVARIAALRPFGTKGFPVG